MILRFDKVSKRHLRPGGNQKTALDDVTFEVGRGELVGIFGASGSGKTTLLRIAAGLLAPDHGAISYCGERFDQMSKTHRARVRRREIACVWSEQPWDVGFTAQSHVEMPLLVDGCGHRAARERARTTLLICEADQCAEMELADLSDGERQRVAIARALAIEPRLLLADAPAAHLSLAEQEQIMRLLSATAREGKVAVLVTDSNETMLGADNVHYLSEGKLIVPEPMSELGRIYPFPSARSPRAAADA
jgi:ABC-type lipoprotein export system ATPase subunit